MLNKIQNWQGGFNLIDAICDILSQHINVQQDKSPNRKKKRGQQQN